MMRKVKEVEEIPVTGKTLNTLDLTVMSSVIGSTHRLGIKQTRNADRGSEHKQVLYCLSP